MQQKTFLAVELVVESKDLYAGAVYMQACNGEMIL